MTLGNFGSLQLCAGKNGSSFLYSEADSGFLMVKTGGSLFANGAPLKDLVSCCQAAASIAILLHIGPNDGEIEAKLLRPLNEWLVTLEMVLERDLSVYNG